MRYKLFVSSVRGECILWASKQQSRSYYSSENTTIVTDPNDFVDAPNFWRISDYNPKFVVSELDPAFNFDIIDQEWFFDIHKRDIYDSYDNADNIFKQSKLLKNDFNT